MEKKLLLTLSKERGDFKVDYFSGKGPGGQNRNKSQKCCRISHPESGAVGTGQDERSREQNTRNAFNRLVSGDKFQKWLKVRTSRQAQTLAEIEAAVEESLKQVKVEVRDENGRWVEFQG